MLRKHRPQPPTGSSFERIDEFGKRNRGRQINEQMYMIGFAVDLYQFAAPCFTSFL